jgi:hypothetical protein
MTSLCMYILVGAGLLYLNVPPAQRYTSAWWGCLWYIAMWLPIEIAEIGGNWAAVVYKYFAKEQWELENAILQSLLDECTLDPRDLEFAVHAHREGIEHGSLTYWYTLRLLVKNGLVHKKTHETADHYSYYRVETWYSLTKSGIREVQSRGLH